MDAKNAFLNGDLEETVYLCAPAGHDVPEGSCLLLHKAIYGLKQAPRVWYSALKKFFVSVDFIPSSADPCLFISQTPGWPCLFHVYVNNMIIISPDVGRFKDLIRKAFVMEDLGEAKHLLGLKLTRLGRSQLHISQEVYTLKILKDYGFVNCWPVSTPMVPNTCLVCASDEEHQLFLELYINYRRVLGSLYYLAVSTRPDISYATSQLLQHLERPGTTHWNAVVHLLRYLSSTSHLGIYLSGSGSLGDLAIYTDSDYTNCPETRRLYSGYISQLNGNLISWKSKKQPTVSTSTTEAKYRAVYEGVQELTWLHQLLSSLSIPSSKPRLLVDNQAAISLTVNPLYQQRTKHMDVIFHWICEKFESLLFSIAYVPTANMLANICTKALPPARHHPIIEALNLNEFE